MLGAFMGLPYGGLVSEDTPLLIDDFDYLVDYPNIPGEMILFPSYIHHYTTRHYSFKPRITIAFDLRLDKRYNSSILL